MDFTFEAVAETILLHFQIVVRLKVEPEERGVA
jgi:hypothetical protein